MHGDAQRANDAPVPQDQPLRLAHAVLNSHAVEATRVFFEKALGFVLADRTRIMAFMNCDNDHHTIALGDTDNDALNHVAFLMPNIDAVMRGGGRLKDSGLPPQWGPGRHGPGDNVFNYFVDPFGIVIEYTAEIEQIDIRLYSIIYNAINEIKDAMEGLLAPEFEEKNVQDLETEEHHSKLYKIKRLQFVCKCF